MGALKAVNSSNGLQSKFDKYLDGVKIENKESAISVNTALKDSKTYQSSVNSGASFGFNDIVNAGVGATVAGAVAQPVLDWIKKKYDEKAKELGVGKYADTSKSSGASSNNSNNSNGSSSETSSAPSAPASPSGASGLSPASSASNTSLIDVLKTSSNNVGSVAEVVLYSNSQIVASLEKLNISFEKMREVIVLNGEVQQAYNDVNLQMSQTVHDVEVAYKEQGLTNHTELMNKLEEVVSKGVQLDTVKADLNARMTAIDNVNNLLKSDLEHLQKEVASNPETTKFKEDLLLKLGDLGVTIKRSENEVALTDKKLEKVNYELTPTSFSDIHGNDTITASPLELATMKNIGVATSTALENSTTADELGLDDFNDSLDFSATDLFKIFKFNGIADNLAAIANINEDSFASHIPNVDLK
ncbi:MAG: hypothetical protein PHQ93_06175 [Sulfurimonas sp.]|uniref:hypothetical protein n=1 Tax=Sulfurimonas sp. TaxID=2022749 RepID=UPI00261AE47A|nr:hypothetical protein [Sulfurimonas sp.]MDD5400752.1 hypothetical protein [Sulfurimonas sp.]